MKASEAYMEFSAIKAHFERPSYDYFKYNGKVKCGDLEKKNFKSHFFRLSRAYSRSQLHDYFIANHLAGNTWVANMDNDTYIKWAKHMAHLMTDYKSDLSALHQLAIDRHLKVKDIFKIESEGTDGSFVEHPILFRLLMGEYIQIETFILLSTLIGFMDSYDRLLKDDPIWEEWSLKIKKYTPIVMRTLGKNIEYRKYTVEILLNTPVDREPVNALP